jgi:L-ascorbate metabolism protein UlaG (beta-lactamase superfamily)
MIQPLQSDDDLLRDIANVAISPSRLDVWWLGQSTFLCKCNGTTLLFDPYLSDSLTAKYKTTDKPHVRMSRRVVAPDKLINIDIVTCTHIHTDHLDAQTLNPLFATNPRAELIFPRAIELTVRERVQTPPARMVGVNAGQTVPMKHVPFNVIASAHDKLETDAAGNHKYLGYVVRLGAFTVYHSGDGVAYDGLVDTLKPLAIDIAILPINGKVGNMNGADAARLASEIGAKLVIPCHYHLFEFNTAEPEELFVPECKRLGQPYRVLQLGERLTLEVSQ